MQVMQAPHFAGSQSRKAAGRNRWLKTAAMAAALAIPAVATATHAADRVEFSVAKVASTIPIQESRVMQEEALALGLQVQAVNRQFRETLLEIYKNRAQYGDADFQAETERVLPELLAEHAVLEARMQVREIRFQEQMQAARTPFEQRALVRSYMDEVGNRYFGPVEATVNQVHRFSAQRNMTALTERIQPLKAEVDRIQEQLRQFEADFGPD